MNHDTTTSDTMPTFDRFDICCAYNLYSQLYGWDDYTRGIQSRLRTIAFKPSHSDEFVERINENAQDILLELVARKKGEYTMEDLRRQIRPETGDVTLKLENSDDDPTFVNVYVNAAYARIWAGNEQTTQGSTWECDGDTFAYNSWAWHPEMLDELLADGYELDLSEYSEPDEDDIRAAQHAAECAACAYDHRKARKHIGLDT
jgi:hypothetical protein